jgi:hypothetical protein
MIVISADAWFRLAYHAVQAGPKADIVAFIACCAAAVRWFL